MKRKDVPNWINGKEIPAVSGKWFAKINPHDGREVFSAARSGPKDVSMAVEAAKQAQANWSEMPPVKRGFVLHSIVEKMKAHKNEIASVVAVETGKSKKDALAETEGAIALGLFYASEGQRLYGRTTTSGVQNKYAMTIRQPIGVAGLIIAANTPIANVAWKVFPALICGNGAVLKASEDAPATAWVFGQIAHMTNLPPGVLNIIQGFGQEAGTAIVEHPDIEIISFTGSTAVGRYIQQAAGERLVKVSLELGGKNPLVVCDDADLENAAKWVLLSAFSNAGQRCASGSRILVFDAIYEEFRELLVSESGKLKLGPTDEDDLGPVINEGHLDAMLAAVEVAKREGARILTGGERMMDEAHKDGFYMQPTLIENTDPQSKISTTELFGPISILYRVKDFEEALAKANTSPYGLTAAIHTRSLHRAFQFSQKVQSGVAVVNAGTYGSEPHMPFGGMRQSGNGWREPGTEALDIYSELKNVYISIDPQQL